MMMKIINLINPIYTAPISEKGNNSNVLFKEYNLVQNAAIPSPNNKKYSTIASPAVGLVANPSKVKVSLEKLSPTVDRAALAKNILSDTGSKASQNLNHAWNSAALQQDSKKSAKAFVLNSFNKTLNEKVNSLSTASPNAALQQKEALIKSLNNNLIISNNAKGTSTVNIGIQHYPKSENSRFSTQCLALARPGLELNINMANDMRNLASMNAAPNKIVSDMFTAASQHKDSLGFALNLRLLNNLTNKFNNKLAKYHFVLSPFNKHFPFELLNTKQRRSIESLPFKLAEKIIKYTFLSIGAFISKPVFTIYNINDSPKRNLSLAYNYEDNLGGKTLRCRMPSNRKILIELFYYVKMPKYRLFNNFVSDNLNTDGGMLNNDVMPIRNDILNTFSIKFQYLLKILGNLFNSDIELECIRLNKTYLDSNILVQDIAVKSFKYRFVKLTRKLFRAANIINPNKSYNFNLDNLTHFPSYLSGINIKLAGRSFKEKIIPRKTVKHAQKGTLTNVNIRLIQKSRFTGKTRRGSYSFTVILAHLIKN